ALADVEIPQPVHRILDPVSQGIVKDGRAYRGLRPVTPEEAALFACFAPGPVSLASFPQRGHSPSVDAPRQPKPEPTTRRQWSSEPLSSLAACPWPHSKSSTNPYLSPDATRNPDHGNRTQTPRYRPYCYSCLKNRAKKTRIYGFVSQRAQRTQRRRKRKREK